MSNKHDIGSDYGHSLDTYCVDANPELMLGSSASQKGALLVFVVADCNHSFMPCAPYKHHVPLSCAVCSS